MPLVTTALDAMAYRWRCAAALDAPETNFIGIAIFNIWIRNLDAYLNFLSNWSKIF